MSKPRKRLNLFNRILLLLNWLAIFSLLFSYAGNYIDPLNWVIPAFFALAYPAFVLINLVFIVYWMFSRKAWFLLSLVVILAGWNYLSRYYQLFNESEIDIHDTDSFVVLSYNVHNLTENNFQKLDEKQNEIFRYVVDKSPDVSCLQEFFSIGDNYYFPLAYLKEELRADNYYFQSYYNPYREKIVGMAIFSKLPRIDKGIIKHDSTRNFGIYADLVFKQDTFRVYNIHLASLYLGLDDYEMVTGNDLSGINNNKLKKRPSMLIMKLKSAFKNRAFQVNLLRDHIEACPYPVIICGDFNDFPTSYAYQELSNGLHDAFLTNGYGMGKTFGGKLPFFRIDYILYDSVFTSVTYQTEKLEISDHFPVSSTFIKR